MIKNGPALAQITMHRPQNFYVDSQNLYALGVHGDFHLDTFLAMWHVGTWPETCPNGDRRIPQVHTYVRTSYKKFHVPTINICQEPWLATLR